MKKINLIEWLWKTDSHEKQKPQRFARYAAILIMLLTLGVGQMWAVNSNFTKGETIFLKAGTNSAYRDGAKVKMWYNNNGTDKGGVWTSQLGSGSYNYTVVPNTGANKVQIQRFSSDGNTWWNSDGDVLQSGRSKDVYNVINSQSYGASWANQTFGFYLMGGSSGGSESTWSGTGYGMLSDDGDAKFTITCNVVAVATTMAFKIKDTDGTWYGSDHTLTGCVVGATYSVTADFYLNNVSYLALSKTQITFAVTASSADDAMGSVSPSSAWVGSSGVTFTATPETGYHWTSWESTGGASPSNAATSSVTATANGTITANFAETMSTVSFVASPTGKGTFQVGGAAATSTTAGVTTTRSVTAVPISGYRFTGWSISGGASISSTSDNPTTVTGGGAGTAATLTATFEEDITYYTLNFGARSGETTRGSATAVNSSTSAALTNGSSYISGTGVTVTANVIDDDYKFDCWYNAASGGSVIDGAGNPYSFTLTSNKKAYAHFVQKTTTVTINRNGGSGGSDSFTATHGSTLPSFTMPARTGYTLTGLWTESSGGTKIVNADKTLVASVTDYTTSGKKWDYDDATLTLYAQWTENMTTVTVNVSPAGTGTLTVGGAAFTPGNTTTAGKTTSRTVVATAANDYAFSSWSVTGNATGTNSTNTYTLKGNGSAGTGTLTANFTQVPCTLWYHTSSATFATKTGQIIMSYDTDEHAYYADVASTPSSPYYFRFYHNGATQYSAAWDGSYPNVQSAVPNGSKITCNQNVGGWENKSSIKYVGESSTSIRIWFDFQNQKTWITANKDKEYVLRGSTYADSSTPGGMPGWGATTSYFDGLASGSTGTITATLSAATKYKFKVYDMYTKTWYGKSGSGEQEVADGTKYDIGNGDNFYFTSTIAGTYTFTVDKTSGTKVKVDFPVSYQLNYDIGTVKGTSGSISTSPSTSSGSYVPSGNSVTLTAPDAKTGYTWSGWFTNEAGTEGQIADEDRAITVTMNADKTLYACYTENEYPVTVSTGANGDVSPKGTVNVKQINGTSLTATADPGYHFVDWTISDGGITPGTSTSATQTFKATTTGGTIHANFAETMHTVNVASNNTAFGTVSPSSVSAGIATASETITATPVTGATFTGWTLPGSGVTIVAPATTSSTSITINATADSKSITANFSETKHTVTLTNQNSTYGDVNTSSPVSVGQITAVQIRATPKSGYMFAGWVKMTGDGTVTYHTAAGTGKAVDPTGNTQSTTYITIDGNATLQATWEEDRSSGWFLRGTWPDGWSETGEKPFIKNVGETTGHISHVLWTLDPRNFTNATLYMKMYDGSDYYGHWNGDDDANNKCTKDGNNSDLKFYKDTGGDPHSNFRISISVYGEYDFEWDDENKELTVHYPEGNFIRGDFNSWGWEDLLKATGTANEYAGSIHLAANQTWTAPDHGFKAVILGDHYGKNSTNLTRASNTASSLSREGANIGLTTDVAGDYTFTINTSSKNLSVTYPTAYTVTFGYGVGGSAVTASATSRAGSFASGGYVADGDDVTFSQTPAAGYTFKGWYTTADGNATVPTMGESDNVLNGLSGNATVYAQYIPTTYTNVTLNATTGSTNGAYSVTFGGTSITVTTLPTKTGYEPEGYYESYADGVWTNKIANPNGSLINNTTYTDATGHWTATNRPILYTKWQPKKYGLTLDKNGSSAGYLENGSVTATYDSNTLSPVTAPTRTGYHIVDGYYKEPGLTNMIITEGGALCASTAYTDASSNWTNDGAVTLFAKWAPNTYTITFDPAGGTVDPTSASVTFDAAISDAPVPTRTGYTFTGYNTAGGTSITTNGGVFKSNVAGFTDGSAHWIQPDDATITAQWSANTYRITLTQSGETGYGSTGTAYVDATYDAALPTIPSLPTAADGYSFMGYFTGHNGEGTQYYGADGTRLVATYTTASALELFAYFKKAEITDITFSPATVVAHESTVTVTPVVAPTPTGTTTVCWELRYSNDNPLATTFTPASGNSVSFTAPAASGMYKVVATLRLGSGCEGEVLNTYVANFQVAGDHEVTVQYKDADGTSIAASGTVIGKPLEWSAEPITAPAIFGYTFHHWAAGDGVTLSKDRSTEHAYDTAQVASIYIKAIYDGRLTAVYNQNAMIYFKNTLNWSDVYVNFYSSDYWDSDKGSGNENLTIRNRQMTRIGETDVWYFDYGALGITPSQYVSFTEYPHDDTNGVKYFWKETVEGVGGANVVYPARRGNDLADKANALGFYSKTPMFIPLSTQPAVVKNNYDGGKANYYNDGYWTKYTAGTGYTLELYYDNDGSPCIQSVPFTSADELMPMQAVLDLEATHTYRFQLKRDGDVYYGNSGTMTYADHGQNTAWDMTTDASRRNDANDADVFAMCKITTNASGNYTFNLSYSGNNPTPPTAVHYCLRMEVDYPISDGDYRVIYTDAKRDSGTRYKPSAIVTKANNSKDTVSFFIRPSSSPVLKIQQATVNGAGAITWNDYSTISSYVDNAGGDALSKDSVYNICLTMDGSGVPSVEKVEAYTGNFYIRSDAAGGSKWDNFRTADHMMTYSEYSEKNAGYSHYFMSHLYGGSSVKFVVANDYSPCISDTLVRQAGDIDHVTEDGNLWTNDSTEANIRFMWNRHDNSVARAYLAAAKSDGTKFLVLRANSSDDLMDANGNALLYSANQGEAGYNHKAPDNSVQFVDDDNWIYETTVKVRPNAFVKLYARYHHSDFYYKGVNNNTFDRSNAIQILGGSEEEAEKIRVIYDFKTDRLVSAWLPSGQINDEREIYADVMFIREHQGDIEQLTLKSGEGAIKEINTAYGVLRFNKWTMNNKSKAEGHSPLASPASIYERSLYWISFPFKVKLSEVFGFGSYMTHWGVQKYDGADRAVKGHFLENGSFWRWMSRDEILEPNQGYLLSVDADLLGESSSVWNNGVENVELFFPSYGAMPDITSDDVAQTIPEHTCTINWYETGQVPGPDTGDPKTSYNRTIYDSHWNVLSVPTYVNTKNVTFANDKWIAKVGPNFLYTWNPIDNTITPTTASGYEYHAMHAYMVQYAGSITWAASSGSPYPAGIVARKTYEETPSKVELRLEIQQNEKMIDRTYVVMSNDENVSADFAFGEDMTKEFNTRKASIFNYTADHVGVAGNTMPMSEQTTIIPLGVKIATTGDYTFAIPSGTSGVGVTLVDLETGVRTNLALFGYDINLEAGDYNERFLLEISPIQHISEGIEEVNGEGLEANGVRKVLIDNVLYIIRDGKVFDAQGKRLH